MAGINVNQLTSMLAKLQPDSALQQYAQLHKNDPYVMSLAVSESNRRKELRAAGQGAQGMQPQPKVADAAIAQMGAQPMPEEMGIGALPAQNMQQMADGGIAGYDGYDEGGMTYGQEPVMMMAEGGVARYQVGGATKAGPEFIRFLRNMGVDYMDFAASPAADKVALTDMFEQSKLGSPAATAAQTSAKAAATGKPNPSTIRALNPAGLAGYGLGLYSGELNQGEDAELARRRALGPTLDAQTQTSTFAPAVSRSMLNQAEQPARSNAAVYGEPQKAAPRPTTTRPGAGPAVPAAAAVPKDDPFSMDSIRKAQAEAMGDSNYKIGALNNQLVEIRNKADMQVQQRLDDRKKEIESEGDVYKDRSDRLVERAKGLASQKNENTGLALLNAGLAIMSTPGKLMEAIGKGAQVGTAQYAAGIKDLRAAQERLDDANERIAELRLNRKDLNSREIRGLEKDRDNAILEGQKMVFGFAKDVYGMDRKQAEATFASYMSGQEKKATIDAERENTLTRERGAAARSAAQIAATLNTPDRLVFNQLLKDSGNDAVKAAESLQKMKTEKFNVYDAYSKYLQAFAGKDTLKGPDDFEVFAKRFIPTVTPSKNTTIRTQPGG
jgi:hypothetical protein